MLPGARPMVDIASGKSSYTQRTGNIPCAAACSPRARGSFPLKGSNRFPRAGKSKTAAEEWKHDVKLLVEVHRSMRQAISALHDEQLNHKPEGSKVEQPYAHNRDRVARPLSCRSNTIAQEVVTETRPVSPAKRGLNIVFRRLRLSFLEKYQEYGVIFIRLIVGFHLIYGTQDNVFSYQRMQEFASFLAARNVPFPLLSAFVSVYAQFICGLLFVAGAATRLAAAVMIINFIAAIVIAHIGDTYAHMFPALMMLAAVCFFFLHGPGKLSVDSVVEKRRR